MGEVRKNSDKRRQWAKTGQRVSTPGLHSAATVGTHRVPSEVTTFHHDRAWLQDAFQPLRHTSLKSHHSGAAGVVKHSYSEPKQPSFRCALEGLEQIYYQAL